MICCGLTCARGATCTGGCGCGGVGGCGASPAPAASASAVIAPQNVPRINLKIMQTPLNNLNRRSVARRIHHQTSAAVKSLSQSIAVTTLVVSVDVPITNETTEVVTTMALVGSSVFQ